MKLRTQERRNTQPNAFSFPKGTEIYQSFLGPIVSISYIYTKDGNGAVWVGFLPDPFRYSPKKTLVFCPAPPTLMGTRLTRLDPTRPDLVFFFKKKRLLNVHDLNKLVPVVVLGEIHEFLGCIGPVLGLAHEDGGGVGPNPGENQFIAGDGKERKIGPTLRIEDGEQPLHISNRRFEKVRDLSKIRGGSD